jgi:hypothetical protein
MHCILHIICTYHITYFLAVADVTVRARVGGSACEHTVWTSRSCVICRWKKQDITEIWNSKDSTSSKTAQSNNYQADFRECSQGIRQGSGRHEPSPLLVCSIRSVSHQSHVCFRLMWRRLAGCRQLMALKLQGVPLLLYTRGDLD